MTPLESQFAKLKELYEGATMTRKPSGATLIDVPDVEIPDGWNNKRVRILFVAPAGYPSSAPDCFWAEPRPIRLAGGGTPQASNDSNEIPEAGSRGTWFSWHVQSWNPNRDTLETYLQVCLTRFKQLS